MRITPKQSPGHTLGWSIHRGLTGTAPGRFQVSFFVRAVFSIAPLESVALSAAEGISPTGDTPFADASLGLRYPSDFVPRKPFGEVILVGTAHPPAGRRLACFPVRVAVGAWSKQVEVHGDRAWDTSGLIDAPGRAAIAGAVTLSFAHAWGGADVPGNPLGFGPKGTRVPNLELPERPIRGRRSRLDPAGFCPVPPDWPQRRQHAGTPGHTGLASWWPWTPPEFDERFWMATLPDQWVEGYFRGDEPIELSHLHPEHPEWRMALPGTRARVFVLRLPEEAPLTSIHHGKLSDAPAIFEEVPLVLDTVFMDTDAGEMTLVWRGSTPVRSPKLLDILGVTFGLESLGENRDPETYLAKLCADESPQVSEEPAPPDSAAIRADIEAAIADGESQRARIVAAIEADLAKAEEAARQTISDAQAQYAAERAKASAELARGGIADSVSLPEFRFADAMRFGVAEPATVPSCGPVEEMRSVAAELRATAARAEGELSAAMQDAIGQQTAELEKIVGLVAEAEGIPAAIEAKMKEMKEQVESAFPPGFLVDRTVKPGALLDLGAIRRDGLENHDVRGVDFSGLDLGGVSFRGATAAGALFRQAKLAGVDFTGTDLTGADLTGADLSGAVLDQADLTAAIVADARWTGAHVDGANFRGLPLAEADFTGATGRYADFSGADLSAAVFRAARLDRPDFSSAQVAGADFSGAILAKADFGGAACKGAIFDDASLPNLRARAGADFTEARLHRAHGVNASWATSILDRADFRGADVQRGDFSECSLDGTNFDRCDLASAVFADSTLHATLLTNANLFRVSFDRATVVDVRFDGSSLFEAGFWDASLVQATFAGAVLDRVTLPTPPAGPGQGH